MTTDPPTLLAALQAELAAYLRQRAAFEDKEDVDPAYRAGVLKMWDAAISVKRGQIQREETHR